MPGLILAVVLLDADWPTGKARRVLANAPLADDNRGVAIQLLDESVLLTAERAVCEDKVFSLMLNGWIGAGWQHLVRAVNIWIRYTI